MSFAQANTQQRQSSVSKLDLNACWNRSTSYLSLLSRRHHRKDKRNAKQRKIQSRSDERKKRRSLMLIFKSLAAKKKRNHLNSCFPIASPGHNFPLLRFLVKTQRKKTTERLNRSKSFFLLPPFGQALG